MKTFYITRIGRHEGQAVTSDNKVIPFAIGRFDEVRKSLILDGYVERDMVTLEWKLLAAIVVLFLIPVIFHAI